MGKEVFGRGQYNETAPALIAGAGRADGLPTINADLTTDCSLRDRSPLRDQNEAAGAAADGQPGDSERRRLRPQASSAESVGR